MTTQSFLRRSFALLLSVLLASRAPAAVTQFSVADWPLHFEPNHGQTRDDVKFLAHGPGYGVYLTANEALLALSADAAQDCKVDDATAERERVVRMTLLGGAKAPAVHAVDEQKGKANYFAGTDSSKWRTNIPTYAKVRYDAVYPGIDVVYYGTQRQLEYDFVLAPGADPRTIEIKFDGADRVEIDANGDLVLHVCGREIRQPKPVVYQEAGGRREVAGRYVRKGGNRIGFTVATYDHTLPLIIDPLVLSYASYLPAYVASQVAVDVHGSAYVTAGNSVMKFDSSGSLVYWTQVGRVSAFAAIAVDREGSAYIAANTFGPPPGAFPTTPGAFKESSALGPRTLVAKIDPTGSGLVYATLLQGEHDDYIEPGSDGPLTYAGAGAITVDASGSAYVTGVTRQYDFPTTSGAFQNNQYARAYVAKLNAAGSALVYSSLFASAEPYAIALGGDGSAFVTGTVFGGLPVTTGAFQTSWRGSTNAFVTKLGPVGELVYSTYLGGQVGDTSVYLREAGRGIAVDAVGNAYVAGWTDATDFPTTPRAYRTTPGSGFLTKLNSTGTGLVYSTYLDGGAACACGWNTGALGVAVETGGRAYVAGGDDDLVTVVEPSGSWASVSGIDVGPGVLGIALNPETKPEPWVVGSTDSTNFPTTPNAYQRQAALHNSAGPRNAFIVKLSTGTQPVPATIEAADFDQGREGLGYHENTPGNGGDAGFRTSEDVDVFVSNDTGGGPYIVKNFEAGEWLAYAINVPAKGNYDIAVRASTHPAFPNAAYRIEIDGWNMTGTVVLPDTGGWDNYQRLGKRTVSLASGNHVLKLIAEQAYFNVSAIEIDRTVVSAPYFRAPSAVPGLIEAESFDADGEGIAYHDNSPGNQGDAGFRAGEDVDIFSSNDTGSGSGYIVKSFETGEWLAYTINVPTSGEYGIDLRASTHPAFPNAAYHLEIDGTNMTGTVVLVDTSGWDSYQWVGKTAVSLPAGVHVLKLVAENQYFNLDTIRITPTAARTARAYYGAPMAVPGVLEAEAFDVGGEGFGYHDNAPGNQGDSRFRDGDSVDIFVTNDAASGSPYIVKNLEAGEWLSYTVNVAAGGNYDVELRAATNAVFPNSAYHLEVDGVNVTGAVVLPDTGGWDNYQWLGKRTVTLTAGAHTLTITSDQAYFNLNSLRLVHTPP